MEHTEFIQHAAHLSRGLFRGTSLVEVRMKVKYPASKELRQVIDESPIDPATVPNDFPEGTPTFVGPHPRWKTEEVEIPASESQMYMAFGEKEELKKALLSTLNDLSQKE